MTLYGKIFSKFNIQILIMLVSIDYIIYFTYSILDDRYMSQVDYSMLKYSILNLVINLVLYILFLINRTSLDKLIEKYSDKDMNIRIESIAKKTKMELNLITVSLVVLRYMPLTTLFIIFFI